MFNVLQRVTIYRLLQQMEAEGNVNPRPIPGRPRCTSAEDDELLLNLIQENGFRSARRTIAEIPINCTAETVRRRWREQGYYHRSNPCSKANANATSQGTTDGFCLRTFALG